MVKKPYFTWNRTLPLHSVKDLTSPEWGWAPGTFSILEDLCCVWLPLYFFVLALLFLTLKLATKGQTIKVRGLFFSMFWLEKLGYEHALQPYTFTLRPFLLVGGGRLCINSNPPTLPPFFMGQSGALFNNVIVDGEFFNGIKMIIFFTVATPGLSVVVCIVWEKT